LHIEACVCTIVLLFKHMAAHIRKCDNWQVWHINLYWWEMAQNQFSCLL